MEFALAILFATVVVLYPVVRHLIPAVLLCVSGLFVNLLQAICFVCIRPISAKAYTRLKGVVKELDWRILLGIVDCCAGIKILECVEQKTSHLKGEDYDLVVSNPRKDADPLLELVLSQGITKLGGLCLVLPYFLNSVATGLITIKWSGCLGSLLAVMKTSTRYSPVIKSLMWISKYYFSRNCAHDARKLKWDLKEFPQAFWLSVVLERTGFTQGDLLAGHRLPVPSKVLSSDRKDLVFAVRSVYAAVPAIYAITLATPKTSSSSTLESVLNGGPYELDVYIKRHVTENWPETDDADEKWCTKILAAKDALLDEHAAEQTCGNKGLLTISWPLKCFVVVISPIVLWAVKFDFVCCSTLIVLSATLFTGRVLALFGCGVLSMLQCVMGAAIANITWSDHLKTICGWLIYILGEWMSSLPCD